MVVATTRPETMLGDTGGRPPPDDERYKDLVERPSCPWWAVKFIVADEYVRWTSAPPA